MSSKINAYDKWDERFLRLAREISLWSKDPSTKVGSVIVSEHKTILSTGYNGFPRQMRDDPEKYADRDSKLSRILHAEVNAIIHLSARLTWGVLYIYPFAPCDHCCVMALEAGIKRFCFPKATKEAESSWGASFEKSKQYITECGLWYNEVDMGAAIQSEPKTAPLNPLPIIQD